MDRSDVFKMDMSGIRVLTWEELDKVLAVMKIEDAERRLRRESKIKALDANTDS
jgi:hypothetical protein